MSAAAIGSVASEHTTRTGRSVPRADTRSPRHLRRCRSVCSLQHHLCSTRAMTRNGMPDRRQHTSRYLEQEKAGEVAGKAASFDPTELRMHNTWLPAPSEACLRTVRRERRSCDSASPVRTSGLPRHQATGLSQPEAVAEVASGVTVTSPGEWRRFAQGRYVARGVGPRGIEGVHPIPE